MNKFLNSLEFAILQEVFKSDSSKIYLELLNHLPYLLVSERKFTGVGFYIDFKYDKEYPFVFNTSLNVSLSSSKTLKFDSFDEYFSFELDVTEGRINFIELVTYENGWSGKYESFDFEE